MPSSFQDMISFNHISAWPTGSRYICDPPPMDTDEDTVILVGDLNRTRVHLTCCGWDIPNNDKYAEMENKDGWFSAKKEIDGVLKNYIIIQDQDKYRKWVIATETAKKLNLLKKEDRIFLFSVIVDERPLY